MMSLKHDRNQEKFNKEYYKLKWTHLYLRCQSSLFYSVAIAFNIIQFLLQLLKFKTKCDFKQRLQNKIKITKFHSKLHLKCYKLQQNFPK